MLIALTEKILFNKKVDFYRGITRGVNLVRFPGFWPKPGTRTWVPRFFVFGNWNRNWDPGKTEVPVTGQFQLYPVR
jgi:hypothetical protein